MRTRHPFPDVDIPLETSGLRVNELDANEEPSAHPDYCEKGTELALGLVPHRGENRTQRRAAVANFQAEGADRRELWRQRQRQRRGKLDPELRRLQRKALKK
jgi:hypothetical protein